LALPLIIHWCCAHILSQPVPFLSQKEIQEYRLTVDLTAYGKGVWEITLEDMKRLPKTEIIATLQCSGNRRGDFNDIQRTSGTAWGQGAIGTAKWGGVRLRDLLKQAGVHDPLHAEEVGGMEHVRFYSLDGMMASIGIEKALNPYGDCLIAYEMNDEPLPRDHGFPLRVIVPGYAAVRNVKWLNKIELAATEAEGPWQRGLNYKTLPPSVTDAQGIDLDKMPSMTEVSLFSGITHLKVVSQHEEGSLKPGEKVTIQCSGWAWAGGGRNIVRVDVTGDEGQSWFTAVLKEGSRQKFGRAWAWTFWECQVEAVVAADGKVHLASKAVDLAFNVQPEHCSHSWNVRGLGNNSWYRTTLNAVREEANLPVHSSSYAQ
jgi:sulfite oxidase